MSSNNKLMYLLVGAGAVVVGALAYHFISGSKSALPDIIEDVEALGDVKKDSRGILTFEYFKNIFILAQKHAKLKFAEAKQDLMARRRNAFKS